MTTHHPQYFNAANIGFILYPEDYKYSSARFHETGEDEFGIMMHWMA